MTFSDTSSVVCDTVHLWTVVLSRRRATTRTTVNTEERAPLHEQLRPEGRPRSLWIESAGAVRPPDRDLALDPWLLGAWLGNERSDTGGLSVGRADLADILALILEHWADRPDRPRRSDGSCRHPEPDPRTGPYGHEEWRPASERQFRRCRRQAEHAAMARSDLSLTTKLDEIGVRRDKLIPRTTCGRGPNNGSTCCAACWTPTGGGNECAARRVSPAPLRAGGGMVEPLRTLGVHPLHLREDFANPVRPSRTWHVIEFTPALLNAFSLPRQARPSRCEVAALERTLASRRVVTSVSRGETVPPQCVAVDAPDSLVPVWRRLRPHAQHSLGGLRGVRVQGAVPARFYALILWRSRGVVPRMLQLVYLGTTSEMVRYEPDEADLLATERKVDALWEAIELASATGEFLPSRGKQCDWCSFKAHCPAWGGGCCRCLPHRRGGPWSGGPCAAAGGGSAGG